MATGDFTDLQTKLNTRLHDSDNFTFSVAEKTELLTEAFNDDYVLTPVWDESLTFSTGTFSYTLPVTLTVIKDIFIKPDNNQDEPEKIAANLWEVVNGVLKFKNGASTVIPDGYTLYLKGNLKYTIDSTVAETNVQEYILNLAQLNALNTLGVIKAMSFLKNDTSMAEIVTIKRELERKVQQYRARLPTAWEVA